MPARLHTGGHFRAWLGRCLGGDAELGDRAWRRILHSLGVFAVVYYVLPTHFFVVLPKEDVLLLALVAVLFLEVLRHVGGIEIPTIRPYEAHRVASFAFFALALVGAILLFPEPVGAAVILGTSLVDPIAGELRRHHPSLSVRWGVPIAAYIPLALVGMVLFGGWPLLPSAGLAVLAAVLAVAVEQPKVMWADDDLAMTFVAAFALYVVGVLVIGLPG
ncbi:MAG: hypothetical protein WB809_03805 [Thermoplasmata archaeon]